MYLFTYYCIKIQEKVSREIRWKGRNIKYTYCFILAIEHMCTHEKKAHKFSPF